MNAMLAPVRPVVAALPPAVAVRDLLPGEEARWDAFVEACPEATFFHRAGWRRVIERSFGHRTHYLLAEAGGRIVGVLPLAHLRSRLFGSHLISTAFCVYGGPAAESDEARAALSERAVALANRLDVDFLEYRTLAAHEPGWVTRDTLYATFRKPIAGDAERDMLAIPRKQRATVRKGIKLGLVSAIDSDTSRLHRVYAESVRNLGTPVFGASYFANLQQEFGEACEVTTVLHGGKPVSSVMSFYFRDEVLPYYGGGIPAARDLAAHDFMYWEVMRRAGARGCRLFDFGRSKYGTGSFDFKKNWGFEARPLPYQYRLRRIGAVPELNPLNPRYRLMIALWKRLPLPVANALGPLLVRNLG